MDGPFRFDPQYGQQAYPDLFGKRLHRQIPAFFLISRIFFQTFTGPGLMDSENRTALPVLAPDNP